jgi:hypothetical protein
MPHTHTHTDGVAWVEARIAEICDECFDPIRPGDAMALYDDVAHEGYTGSPTHTRRTYCQSCGRLLEDSLTTTEAC